MEALTGKIFDIQHFCTHDGPGIRTTVFLKGCALRCAWCHNPESQRMEQELFYHAAKCAGCLACEKACPYRAAHETLADEHLRRERCRECSLCAEACVYGAIEKVGREVTVGEVIREVEKDASYYAHSGGGMTLSGGEAMAQPAFSTALLEAAKSRGIHTAVETSGHGRREDFMAMLPFTDLFLWDVKAVEDGQHKELTRVALEPIIGNLQAVSAAGAEVMLRVLFIPELHGNGAYIDGLSAIVRSLPRVPSFEVIPYHRLGISKREKLGIKAGGGLYREPDRDEIETLESKLRPVFGI